MVLGLLRAVGYGVVGLALFAGVALVGNTTGILSLDNPFATTTKERTGPSVLVSLTDLSEYHAANAYYETVVDIERDTGLVPSMISGERILYVGKGSVDGIVDFSELDDESVVVSDDRTTVSVTLPQAVASEPVLDLEESYVVEHEQGLQTRFTDSDLESEAQLAAVDQMADAAAVGSTLTDLAERNTEAMLRGLLGGLGYTDITVTFAAPAPS